MPGQKVSEQNKSDFGGVSKSPCAPLVGGVPQQEGADLFGVAPPPSTNLRLLETLLVTAANTLAFLAGVCEVALLLLLLKQERSGLSCAPRFHTIEPGGCCFEQCSRR